jgi:hypothetical protein
VKVRHALSGVVVLIGLSAIPVGLANAKPPTPAPAPKPAASSSDELADMVMDALGQVPAAPSTTPVVPPQG